MSRPALLLPVLLLLAFAPLIASGDDQDGSPPKLSTLFEKVAQIEVAVQEISGMTSLPSDDAALRVFLAVSDEGRRKVDEPIVEGSLYRVAFRIGEGPTVEVADVRGLALHLGEHVKHLDPFWAKLGGWPPDLESCVRLPGTEDLFLLGGERGPEDAYDGGANRLYVVRYPVGETGRAELQAYLRLPDLDHDTINDRLEAVAAVATGAPDTWHVFAFKERTAAEGRIPGYFPLVLSKTERGYDLQAPRLSGRRRIPTLTADRERLGAQADACVAESGAIWVLDRWRRELHRTRVAEGLLELNATLDYFEAIENVPGESSVTEPAAPGGRYPGYGRHEAMCFDSEGWLWLAADLGGGKPSVVTVLTPREEEAKDDR